MKRVKERLDLAQDFVAESGERGPAALELLVLCVKDVELGKGGRNTWRRVKRRDVMVERAVRPECEASLERLCEFFVNLCAYGCEGNALL